MKMKQKKSLMLSNNLNKKNENEEKIFNHKNKSKEKKISKNKSFSHSLNRNLSNERKYKIFNHSLNRNSSNERRICNCAGISPKWLSFGKENDAFGTGCRRKQFYSFRSRSQKRN